MIAQELEVSLHLAFVEARQKRHEFITVEHLLLAMLDNPSAAHVLRACGADMEDLRHVLATHIDTHTPRSPGNTEVETQPTVGFQRVIQRAILHVQSSSKKEVTGANILVALFGEKESHAVYFLHQGKHVFIGFDDFTKHAWTYREISLLLGRPPGRDSYPGDIFYLHSKMIERACFLDKERGGGSITFFPIVEILEGDLTAFVPSNLISMTDGQIYLNSTLFAEGQKPALDLGLSVSRVGSKVQWPAIKSLSAPLRLEYLQYRELLRLSKLKTGGQSDEMVEKLKRGAILTEVLKQDKNDPVPCEAQVMIFYAFNKKFMNDLTMQQVQTFQVEILEYATKAAPEFVKKLRERKKLEEEIEKNLVDVLKSYFEEIKNRAAVKKNLSEEDDYEQVLSVNRK